MHKVRGNPNSCTCRSSERICSSSESAQEKWKTGAKPDQTQFGTKRWCISPHFTENSNNKWQPFINNHYQLMISRIFSHVQKAIFLFEKKFFKKISGAPKKLVVFHKEMQLKKFQLSEFACIFTKANNVCNKSFHFKISCNLWHPQCQKKFKIYQFIHYKVADLSHFQSYCCNCCSISHNFINTKQHLAVEERLMWMRIILSQNNLQAQVMNILPGLHPSSGQRISNSQF